MLATFLIREMAVMVSTFGSRMTSARRSSSSRRDPSTSPRRSASSGTSGHTSRREARLFTSAASAETEEVGGYGIRRRRDSAPGGATVTVYLSIVV